MPRLRLGVLISGRGSNLQALVEASADPAYPAEIVSVISDRAEAAGLAIAAAAGITGVAIRHDDRQAFAAEADVLLREQRADLVCLAGFMRVLDTAFVEAWRDRMVNIHPSLLPAFPGLDAQHQALEHGVKLTGCTVHFVDEDLDAGPIVLQAAVPVLDGDTVETLSARILDEEHRIYPEAIRIVLGGRYRIEGRRVIVSS